MTNLLAVSNTNTTKPPSNTNTLNGNMGGTFNPTTVTPTKIDDPLRGQSLLAVGLNLINFLLAMIVIAAVIVIIVSGFRMIADGGNQVQVKQAKKSIVWAIIGIAVAFMSFGIVTIIQKLL